MIRQACLSIAVTLLVLGLVEAQQKNQREQKQTDTPKGLQFNIDGFVKEYDKDRDGLLKEDELPPRLRHYFAQLDTDKNGKLSKQELEKGVVYLQQQRRPSDFVFVMIEMSDCDECCMEEIQCAYDALRRLDANNDGKIDANEMKGARVKLVKERLDGLIKELDEDKDGKIGKDEARGVLKQNFERLDNNRDGVIDRDELQRGAEATPANDKTGAAQKDASSPRPR